MALTAITETKNVKPYLLENGGNALILLESTITNRTTVTEKTNYICHNIEERKT